MKQSKEELNKKRGGNRRSSRRPRKDTRVQRDYQVDQEAPVYNDAGWYFKDASIAEQTVQYPTATIQGRKFSKMPLADNASIAVVWMNPSPGFSEGVQNTTYHQGDSGINRSMLNLYTELAAFSGRATSYSPCDVSMLVLAMGELISTVEHCRRILAIGNLRNDLNWSFPKRALEALAINAEDLFDNKANYITRFNNIINTIDKLRFPDNISYFTKCQRIYQDIYLDDPNSATAQVIIPAPMSTWVLDETEWEGGTILAEKAIYKTTTRTFGELLDLLVTMRDALQNSSTLATIYSDLRRLAEKGRISQTFKLDTYSDTYHIMPKFDRILLLQFHNMVWLGDTTMLTDTIQPYDTGNGYTTPGNYVFADNNTNQIIYNPRFRNLHYQASMNQFDVFDLAANGSIIMDFDTDKPDLATKVDISRWIAVPGKTDQIGSTKYTTSCCLSDHYPVIVELTTPDKRMALNSNLYAYDSDTPASELENYQNWVAAVTRFTNYPFIYMFHTTNPEHPVVDGARIYGDTHYMCFVDYAYLAKVNETITIDLFAVRSIE